MPQRYLYKAEKYDGSESVIFPTHRLEWETSQTLIASRESLVGASYAFDLLGDQPSTKTVALERIRFLVVGDAIYVDEQLDRYNSVPMWGLLKIWTKSASGDRWAWARCDEMPQLSLIVDYRYHRPVIMSFARLSDWYGEEALDQDYAISSNSETIVFNNPGNANITNGIIILKEVFTNPSIYNTSALIPGTASGYYLESARDGTLSNHWLQFDAGRHTVGFSTDTGASYSNDWANVTRVPGQVGLMVFKPGDNSLDISGCNGGIVTIQAYGAWH